jgi:hypothetical protein
MSSAAEGRHGVFQQNKFYEVHITDLDLAQPTPTQMTPSAVFESIRSPGLSSRDDLPKRSKDQSAMDIT